MEDNNKTIQELKQASKAFTFSIILLGIVIIAFSISTCVVLKGHERKINNINERENATFFKVYRLEDSLMVKGILFDSHRNNQAFQLKKYE